MKGKVPTLKCMKPATITNFRLLCLTGRVTFS